MQPGAVCKLSTANNYKHTHTSLIMKRECVYLLELTTNPVVELLDHYTQVLDSGQSSRDFC